MLKAYLYRTHCSSSDAPAQSSAHSSASSESFTAVLLRWRCAHLRTGLHSSCNTACCCYCSTGHVIDDITIASAAAITAAAAATAAGGGVVAQRAESFKCVKLDSYRCCVHTHGLNDLQYAHIHKRTQRTSMVVHGIMSVNVAACLHACSTR
jgi:hypothetical protein